MDLRRSTIVRAKDQVSTDLGGEVVILAFTSGEYYGLQDVGARIWELIQEPKTVIEVRWGECHPLPDDPPAGCVSATLTLGNGRGYTVTDTTTGYTLRLHQTCEFAIGHDLRAVRVHLFPEVHPDMAGLLLVGNVLACLLTFAGEAVLHDGAEGVIGHREADQYRVLARYHERR